MTNLHIYRNIHTSLLRFCADFAGEHNLTPVNLDAFINEDDWPQTDFIGVSNISVDVEETPTVYCIFALSTHQDANLMRMATLMNHLANRLLPNSCLPVYDAETGIIVSSLYVAKGVRIDPPVAGKVQPIQPIIVRLLGDARNF